MCKTAKEEQRRLPVFPNGGIVKGKAFRENAQFGIKERKMALCQIKGVVLQGKELHFLKLTKNVKTGGKIDIKGKIGCGKLCG